jgi:hypothetical protein
MTKNGRALGSEKRAKGRPAKVARSDSTDVEMQEWAIGNVRTFIQQKRGVSPGNPPAVLQQIMDALVCAILHAGPPPEGKVNAFMRVTGFTRNMIERGNILRSRKSISPMQLQKSLSFTIPRRPHSFGAKQKKSMKWVYDWFHDTEKNTMIYVDKRRPEHLKGKYARIRIDGEILKVNCVRHFMDGHKQDLAQLFLNSPEYRNWQDMFPGQRMCKSSVQAAICPCMRPAKVTECACKVCTEMEAVIRAWAVQRALWHKHDKCSCPGCVDPKKKAEYMRASKGLRAFRDVCLCAKIAFPHLALPHLPDMIPEFRSIACCKYSDKHPGHATACQDCGVHNRLYRYHDCIEQNNKPASWMQWQLTEVDAAEKSGGKAHRMVYREKKGTRKLLLDRIFELATLYFYHHWVMSVTTHMGRLRNATYVVICQ